MFGVLKFIKLEVDSAVRIVLRNVGIVISMIFAHLLEAGLFAGFYFVIDAFNDWNTSFYFSLVSYATVGYGDVTLPQHWRLIGGVEGLVGALMVGWSVAVLVAVLQRLRVCMVLCMSAAHLGFPTETVVVFVVMAVGAMFIDLFMHRHDKPISLKSAAMWSVFWVMMAMAFAGFLYVHHGAEMASLFLTGYALEEVLSVDNLFVMMAIFAWFGVPDKYRHRVLYWGVLGAIVFRGIFVAIGTSLLSLGPYVEVIFALVVGWTAVMMLRRNEESDEVEDYSGHLAYRLVKRFYPVWPKISSNAFILTQKEVDAELEKPENQDVMVGRVKKAKRYATPLLLCVAVVELSDVMFAFDSVPAIIAVSREPLIIYSAMMFAILGLRTLYFVLEALKQYLVHLEKAVVLLLFFVAFKLGLNATDHFWHHGYSIGATASLFVVLGVLALGIIASVMFPGKREA
ncbi:hypothetical protein L1887_45429 [Cichorium endivia]|nr:hypothetical protein L1887_45429 [Cichorium endivia]